MIFYVSKFFQKSFFIFVMTASFILWLIFKMPLDNIFLVSSVLDEDDSHTYDQGIPW